jgi:hypothetical protein
LRCGFSVSLDRCIGFNYLRGVFGGFLLGIYGHADLLALFIRPLPSGWRCHGMRELLGGPVPGLHDRYGLHRLRRRSIQGRR